MACAVDIYFLGHFCGHFLYIKIKNKVNSDGQVLEFFQK